jgi:lysylphosphatidylglycerol synthetase-like protein (DUF2156 family)
MAELLQGRRAEIIAALFASEDTQEGIRAFKEKRKPVWAGRYFVRQTLLLLRGSTGRKNATLNRPARQ